MTQNSKRSLQLFHTNMCMYTRTGYATCNMCMYTHIGYATCNMCMYKLVHDDARFFSIIPGQHFHSYQSNQATSSSLQLQLKQPLLMHLQRHYIAPAIDVGPIILTDVNI